MARRAQPFNAMVDFFWDRMVLPITTMMAIITVVAWFVILGVGLWRTLHG